MTLAAFCLAYAGFSALCLGMDRHYEDLFNRALTRRHRVPLRLFGWAALALSLCASAAVWGWSYGTVEWIGILSIAGLLLLIPSALIGWLFIKILFADWLPADQLDSYVAGLILLAAAPCTAMVFVWSRLTGGDPVFTLSQVALNDTIMVFAFAPLVGLLLGLSAIIVPWDTLLTSVVLYIVIPVGIAYAIWSGVGIVLISIAGAVLFKQHLDAPALIGIGLIIAGVVVMNVFSKSVAH